MLDVVTTDVSMIPRAVGWSATRGGVVIERRVDVRSEPVGIDRGGAGERGNRGVCSNELAGAQGNRLADGYAVACHGACLASVEGAHDVAAAVAELPLGDFACHIAVARALRRLHGDAARASPPRFRLAAAVESTARRQRRPAHDLGEILVEEDASDELLP